MNGIQEKQRLGSAQSVSQPIGIMKDNQEMWKDVHDWEGVYMVSSYGQIMSFKCDSSGRILKLTNKKGGYFSFVLRAKGRKNRSCRIHVLVAESFIYKPIGKTQVNHKDCNKQNNHVDNLEWVTPSENMRHAVIMIPSIVSGPINKASLILPQLKQQRTYFDYAKGVEGLKFLLWGMFMKVVVADRSGLYVDVVYNNYSYYSYLSCFMASIMYSIQIYADFAGYSLMAIGTGKILGLELTENFRRPYFAFSVTDFWRRWHISLSTWLKDYVYILLGGNRCSHLKNY